MLGRRHSDENTCPRQPPPQDRHHRRPHLGQQKGTLVTLAAPTACSVSRRSLMARPRTCTLWPSGPMGPCVMASDWPGAPLYGRRASRSAGHSA